MKSNKQSQKAASGSGQSCKSPLGNARTYSPEMFKFRFGRC